MIIPAAPCLKTRRIANVANSPRIGVESATRKKPSTTNDPGGNRLAKAASTGGLHAGDHARSLSPQLLRGWGPCGLGGFFSISKVATELASLRHSFGWVHGVATAPNPARLGHSKTLQQAIRNTRIVTLQAPIYVGFWFWANCVVTPFAT